MHDDEAEVQTDTLKVDLREHGIVFIVPVGAVISGNMSIPGGVLIQGKVTGNINCQTGSIIFAPGSSFAGNAEADKIYIGGNINSTKQGRSALMARTLVAISNEAVVHGDISARMFAVNSRNIFGTMRTITEAIK